MMMSRRMKLTILQVITFAIFVTVFFLEPMAQDVSYHQFADVQTEMGIPNAWNVLSNFPFIVAGITGFIIARKMLSKKSSGTGKSAILLFFVGLMLVGFGSTYYHLLPNNEALLWDRLPMTISFMAFFSFILSFHINRRLGAIMLWPLLLVGMSSVFYWSYTEAIGFGDLRFYAVVQFLPILLIPLILLLFPTTDYQQTYIWLMLILYIAAKLMEIFDADIYYVVGVSGHTIKHVIAAFSGIVFLLVVRSINRYHDYDINKKD